MNDLLSGPFGVANIGLNKFAKDISRAGFSVIDMNWKPPSGGDPQSAEILAALADDSIGIGNKIKSANEISFAKLIEAQPVLKDVKPALEVIPGMEPYLILHAGPPISWNDMVGPVRGAVIGGLLFEGLASCRHDAEKMAASGAIHFSPCHEHNSVGPMSGIITANMPVMVVEDQLSGANAFASLNEGWGRTLRFGAYDDDVIRRLHWMKEELAPSLSAGIKCLGGIDIKALIARAIHMGDECHNRDLAATSLFFKLIAPAIYRTISDFRVSVRVLDFLSENEHFFLNIAMAACKVGLMAADDIPYSTMVTAIARNGTEVGIRVSGCGDTWFTTKATVPHGLYFPGYSERDANPDLGDSAITETSGIGAFAMAAAPAIVRFVGGKPVDALNYTLEMYKITLGEHPYFTIPQLDFRGTPTGIDIRAVVETGITPVINTGIAHKEAGHGLVGAGVVHAPIEAFEKALKVFFSHWINRCDEASL